MILRRAGRRVCVSQRNLDRVIARVRVALQQVQCEVISRVLWSLTGKRLQALKEDEGDVVLKVLLRLAGDSGQLAGKAVRGAVRLLLLLLLIGH